MNRYLATLLVLAHLGIGGTIVWQLTELNSELRLNRIRVTSRLETIAEYACQASPRQAGMRCDVY